jgi:hypothetical protein
MTQDSNGLIFLLGEEFQETFIIQSALIGSGVRNPIVSLSDLQSARPQILQLAASTEWEQAPGPHLAIVSFQQEGPALDFVRWLRALPAFTHVLVIALVDRGRSSTLQAAFDAGANLFHYRGPDFEGAKLATTIRGLMPSQRPELVAG